MDKSISLTSTANPTRLYDSEAKLGLSHLLKSYLLRIPSQTLHPVNWNIIEDVEKLSKGMLSLNSKQSMTCSLGYVCKPS